MFSRSSPRILEKKRNNTVFRGSSGPATGTCLSLSLDLSQTGLLVCNWVNS